MADGVQRRQDGVLGVGEAVAAVPLDVANPQGGARQFGGVVFQLNAQHLVGLDAGRQAVPAPGGGVINDPLFQIQQLAQGNIEEVAAAARRVEDGYGGEAVAKGVQGGAGIGFVGIVGGGIGIIGSVQQGVNLAAGGVPLPAQGRQHYRVNHQHNVGGAGVVGAQPGALGGVQGALKQGAENGRLNVAPVFAGGFGQALQGGGAQCHRLGIPEQIAVEVRDLVDAEQPARSCHLLKQVGDGAVRHPGAADILAQDGGEQAVGQQAGILGVEAKDDAVEMARQPLRVAGGRVAGGLFHIGNDFVEQGGGFLRNLFYGTIRAQGVGVVESVAEQFQMGRFVQPGDGDFVADGFHPRKVGADAYGLERRYDEQRRRFEMHLIAEQLVEGVVQVGVAALELPAEMVLQVGVGEAAGYRLFKGEGVRAGVCRRGGMADQGAQVQEHFLGRLPFAKGDGRPLGDENDGRHYEVRGMARAG